MAIKEHLLGARFIQAIRYALFISSFLPKHSSKPSILMCWNVKKLQFSTMEWQNPLAAAKIRKHFGKPFFLFWAKKSREHITLNSRTNTRHQEAEKKEIYKQLSTHKHK